MSYSELVQAYFERSVALQWYWTIYVIVIGGLAAFSMFRDRPEFLTTAIVTVLYIAFAYKNLGAIEATALERQGILTALRATPANTLDLPRRVRDNIEPTMPDYDITSAKYFHIFCDALTIAFLWTKEWRRRQGAGTLRVPSAAPGDNVVA